MKRSALITLIVLCCVTLVALVGCSSASKNTESAVTSEPVKEESASSAESLPSEPFYVLLLGLDTREGTIDEGGDRSSYSDTMVLVRVDPVTYSIGLVSIPRDTAADVNGNHVKINEAYYTNGPDGAVAAVEQLTGVHISYYMSTTFAKFVEFVNNFGGVDGYVPMYMTLKDIMSGNTIELNEGEQHMDGAQSLVWVRQRKQYPYEGEACRQQNARAFLESAIRKAAADPGAIAAQVDNLGAHVETNMPMTGLAAMAADFCAHADQISFAACSGPYWGGINPENELWEVPRDEGTYHAIIEAIETGQDPQTIVGNPL